MPKMIVDLERFKDKPKSEVKLRAREELENDVKGLLYYATELNIPPDSAGYYTLERFILRNLKHAFDCGCQKKQKSKVK